MSIDFIQHPLTTALEGNQCPLAKEKGIDNPLENVCYLQKLPIVSEEFVQGLPITVTPCNKFAKGCQQSVAHLQEG